MVYDRGQWLRNPSEINIYFLENFEAAYATDNPCILEEFGDLRFEVVSPEENISLMQIPSEEEIKSSIHALHPLKAPGPDGFPGIFY